MSPRGSRTLLAGLLMLLFDCKVLNSLTHNSFFLMLGDLEILIHSKPMILETKSCVT